ncbi:MAG: Sulfite exporter TauE/SafE [Bacilli bacterium]|nr:Sulfite exporter TauE/SafE [Bacilli bacterium]
MDIPLYCTSSNFRVQIKLCLVQFRFKEVFKLETPWALILIFTWIGFLSSVTLLGPGYVLVPVLIHFFSLTASSSTALSESVNTLTSIASIGVESRYRRVHLLPAARSALLALPGTFVGTLLTTSELYTDCLWLICLLASVSLLGTGFIMQLAPAVAQDTKTAVTSWSTESSISPQDAFIHFAIGLLSAATGISGSLYFTGWFVHRLKADLATAVPTAQLAAVLLNAAALLEHWKLGFQFTFWELMSLMYCFIAAWHGSQIAHFYSNKQMRLLYLCVTVFSASLLISDLEKIWVPF